MSWFFKRVLILGALVVTVAKRQSLDAAGVLPTAIVVPAALFALLVFMGYRRRRRR